MQLLPVCCTFGDVGKEQEDDGGQNGQNWFILDGVFCPGEVYFGCLLSPLHHLHTQHCVHVLKKQHFTEGKCHYC